MKAIGKCWRPLEILGWVGGGWVAEGGFRRQNGLRLDKVELDGPEKVNDLCASLAPGFQYISFLQTNLFLKKVLSFFNYMERVKVGHERIKAPQEGVKGK